jgi:hypothetical protein
LAKFSTLASVQLQLLPPPPQVSEAIFHPKWLNMAYKRRRLGSGSSSRAPPSSRPQTFSRLSSVPQSLQESTPALPASSQRTRVSLRPPSSQSSINSLRRSGNALQAENVETDAETQRREDADAMNEIIMAVDLRDRGTIGCAYYVAREEKLCLMEDIKIGGLDIIDTLKIHVQPTVILISNRSDERLEEHLNREARGIDRGEEASKYRSLVSFDGLTIRKMIFSVLTFLTRDLLLSSNTKMPKTSWSTSNSVLTKYPISYSQPLETS